MVDFQQRLCDFLTECKNDALLELKENKTYAAWKEKSADLYGSLIMLMTPECLEAFKLYQEAMSATSGIESDYCYMCGTRDYLRIGKQFSIPRELEWDDFVSYMIPNTEGREDEK